MFSKSCEYGIRAVIFICEKSLQGLTVNVREISNEAEVPEQYLAKVLQQLSKKKIISSIKGPKGGFFISEAQRGLTLINLVEAIDGDTLFEGCGLGLKICNDQEPCPMHKHFINIRNELKNMLKETTLISLAEDLKDGKSKIKDVL